MIPEGLRLLTPEDFEPLIGQSFTVSADEPNAAVSSLKLVAMQRHGQSAMREAFSLGFEGPSSEALNQQCYWFHHAAIDKELIFIVPIADNGENRQYQADFN